MLLHGLGITAHLNWGAADPDLGRLFRWLRRTYRVMAGGVRHGRVQPREMRGPHRGAGRFAEIDRFIACGYSMGSLVAQLIWRRHPDRITALVLGATSRNFLGSPVERLISSLAPAVSPSPHSDQPRFCATLRADAFGTGYLTDIDDESRRYVHAEMQSDQYVDGYCGGSRLSRTSPHTVGSAISMSRCRSW